jgi:hypothetical protein
MYGDRPQEVYIGCTWTGMGSIRVVLVGFSSVECTSIRIAATLGYEEPLVCASHHVDNLTVVHGLIWKGGALL